MLLLFLFLSCLLKAQIPPRVECSPVSITIGTMSPREVDGIFTITVYYQTSMQGTTPDIAFDPETASAIFSSEPTFDWQSSSKLVIGYPVNTAVHEHIPSVNVTVDGGSAFFDILLNRPYAISVTPLPVSVINGTADFSIDVVYSADMNQAVIPDITFLPNIPGKLIPNLSSSQWVNNRMYRFAYDVANDNTQPGKIEATISDAEGVSGETSIEAGCEFYIDFRKPAVTDITYTPSVLTETEHVMEVRITYDEAMDENIAPDIAFSKAGVFTFATGAWETETTYTAAYAVTQDVSGTNDGLSDITVSGAKDVAGNVQDVRTDVGKMDIRQRKPVLLGVTMSPAVINRSATTAVLTLVFDIDMNSGSPVIEFNPQVTGWQFVPASSGWQADNKTYKAVFNATGIPNTAKTDHISVAVSRAVAANGNTMSPYTATDVFSVDKRAPACTDVVFTPSVLGPGATQLVVDLTYDMAMKQSGNDPQITFVHADDTPVNLASVLDAPSASWVSPTLCRITYPVKYNQEQILDVFAKVTGAKSTADNEQSESVSSGSFSVDMKPMVVTVTPGVATVTCVTAAFSVQVEFNQIMSPLPSDENIIGFPGYDNQNDGFLVFDRTEWAVDNRSATVYYEVRADRLSQKENITIHARSVLHNASGRPYEGSDFPDAFSVHSDPPVISRIDAVSPLCHDDANGYIHVTVTGATTPYSYSWSKDGAALAETSSNLDQAQGGVYRIKVTSANSCFASSEQALVNPDPLVLQAEVVQNVIRKDDGIIELSVSGGTPAYSYLMNGMPANVRMENLTVGSYQFEVVDVNACSASGEATVADYRIPTGFTPNGDGYNDTFMEGRKVKIFDRNGTLLFQGDNGWDGQYRGRTVRPAVYYYITVLPDGSEKKGTIQVFKK